MWAHIKTNGCLTHTDGDQSEPGTRAVDQSEQSIGLGYNQARAQLGCEAHSQTRSLGDITLGTKRHCAPIIITDKTVNSLSQNSCDKDDGTRDAGSSSWIPSRVLKILLPATACGKSDSGRGREDED